MTITLVSIDLSCNFRTNSFITTGNQNCSILVWHTLGGPKWPAYSKNQTNGEETGEVLARRMAA
jgi:hypothetical protein